MRPMISWIVNSAIKTAIHVCCRVHDAPLAQVPPKGPLIIISNHITFLEAPVLYTHLLPRPLTGFAKAEFWDKPLSRFLFQVWGGIPVHRGEADVTALRLGIEALEKGFIIGVAPEGTRSYDGHLQQAHSGAIVLALHSGAPILPLAHHGGEKLNENLRRLRRTDFNLAIGQPFFLDAHGKVTRAIRQQMVDESMYRIAALLPPEYRGFYADMDKATTDYLRFIDIKDLSSGT